MRPKWSVAILSLCLFSVVLIAVKARSQSAPAAPTPQQNETKQSSAGQSGYVLKVTTRLVTLDVIATDSHGNPVRDLKPEDLQIFEEHKAQQKIEHFEYFETLKRPGSTGKFRERGSKSFRHHFQSIASRPFENPADRFADG